MQIKLLKGGEAAEVRLSRTNLVTLLHKLDVPGSSRTLTRRGDLKNNKPHLAVIAEEDAAHYQGRQRGLMNEETETFLEKMRKP